MILTAEKDGKTLYAKSKLDGSYRFILPIGDEGEYTVKIKDAGSYEKGIPADSERQGVPVGSTEINFTFKSCSESGLCELSGFGDRGKYSGGCFD